MIGKIGNNLNFTALKMCGSKEDLVNSMQLLNNNGLFDTFEKKCEEIHKKSSESQRDVYLWLTYFKDVGVAIELKTKKYAYHGITAEEHLYFKDSKVRNEEKINKVFDKTAQNIDKLDKSQSDLRLKAYDRALNKPQILYARYAHLTSLDGKHDK